MGSVRCLLRRRGAGTALLAGIGLTTASCDTITTPQQRRYGVMKASDLPLYTEEQPEEWVYVVPAPSDLECAIRKGRQALGPYSGKVADIAGDCIGQVTYAVTSLQRAENDIAKYGAIGLGAVCGSLLAYRRSFFKKLMLPIVGGLGMASICYPDKFSSIKKDAAREIQELGTVGFILVRGMYADLTDRLLNGGGVGSGSGASLIDEKIPATPESEFEKMTEQYKPLKGHSVISLVPPPPSLLTPPIKGDYGQSNPADSDMYTTRS